MRRILEVLLPPLFIQYALHLQMILNSDVTTRTCLSCWMMILMVVDLPVPGGPWSRQISGIEGGSRTAATIDSTASCCARFSRTCAVKLHPSAARQKSHDAKFAANEVIIQQKPKCSRTEQDESLPSSLWRRRAAPRARTHACYTAARCRAPSGRAAGRASLETGASVSSANPDSACMNGEKHVTNVQVLHILTY